MRILVTGMGVLSTTGIGARAAFEGLLAGRACVGGEIANLDPAVFLGNRGLRHFDRTALLLASAARLALDDSGLASGGYAPEDMGVVVGSTHGSLQAIAEFDQESVRNGPGAVNPQDFANTVINAPAGRVSMLFGPTGLSSTIATGTASALDALSYGLRILRRKRALALLCGAALGYSPEIAAGYGRARRLVSPAVGCVPFGADRQGPSLSEGAAVFVLEREDGASARGARALGDACRRRVGICAGSGGTGASHGERARAGHPQPGSDLACRFRRLGKSRRRYGRGNGHQRSSWDASRSRHRSP